ncbi:AAA family ATPase (plasmid) [Iamia sp. SCSIO 61187]|uniref:MinD/ParA family ATP-binding protein n=1 Tax=Iamia sp. SCSIO 61187 TaxID=2722752 RepID=UPI001C624878|nr:AAA family ATPase [Iamia sp. SCSIO 61187]QYG95862.1 AAA family ATPase [Iamia sp. SCSIO 61187]
MPDVETLPTGSTEPVTSDGAIAEWQPQTLIAPPPATPTRGWRRVVFRATGGRVNPGPSADEAHRSAVTAAVTAPLAARTGERIAVLSTKGGVGKTTTALMLGHTLAGTRGDRVVALDANPDYGTLGYRVSPETHRTVRDLLDARAGIVSYPDVRAYTTQAPSRLEVLAGDADPAVSQAFTAQDYADTLAILGQHYNVILTDCGTGVLHDAMRAVLHMATQLVIVTGPAVDQARHADHLTRWLRRHADPQLVSRSTVVVNASRDDLAVDVDAMVDHFTSIARAVIEVPYDPALAAGGIDGLDALDQSTRDAYLDLAHAVVDGFTPTPIGGPP